MQNKAINAIVELSTITIKQASQLIEGVTEYRIRQMCISGELPCFNSCNTNINISVQNI